MFVAIQMTIVVGLLNLVLGVIVDRAEEARDQDTEHQLRIKKIDAAKAKRRFLKMCQQIDSDHDGSLSLEELVSGFDKVPEFAHTLQLMDINTKEELTYVFLHMDADRSGSVTYQEFVDQLHDMRGKDLRTITTFIG